MATHKPKIPSRRVEYETHLLNFPSVQFSSCTNDEFEHMFSGISSMLFWEPRLLSCKSSNLGVENSEWQSALGNLKKYYKIGKAIFLNFSWGKVYLQQLFVVQV